MAKKDHILDWLGKMGRMPTSKIATLIDADYNTTLKHLEELKREKKVVEEKETRATYWRLRGVSEEKK